MHEEREMRHSTSIQRMKRERDRRREEGGCVKTAGLKDGEIERDSMECATGKVIRTR